MIRDRVIEAARQTVVAWNAYMAQHPCTNTIDRAQVQETHLKLTKAMEHLQCVLGAEGVVRGEPTATQPRIILHKKGTNSEKRHDIITA